MLSLVPSLSLIDCAARLLSCKAYCSHVPLACSQPKRPTNLVIPYPSSLLGTDVAKGREAPWASALDKPVLLFSAFGMLANQSAPALDEGADDRTSRLLASYQLHCSPAEQRMISASSCYGKRCRFALRALVLSQLEEARAPPSERHTERSCLREARACPLVMSLTFWAPHDGGEGYSKLSSHAHHGASTKRARDEPLYVDDREANDVLAVYRVMLSATFCVHIGGDTPTRKSFVDALLATCIPVVFHNDSTLLDSLPYRDTIPYEQMMLYVPLTLTTTPPLALTPTPTGRRARRLEDVATTLAMARAADSPSRRLNKATHQRKAKLHDVEPGSSAASGATSYTAAKAAQAERLGRARLLFGGELSLVALLRSIPDEVIRKKRALLRAHAPKLQYPYPKMATKSTVKDTAPNAVSLAIERLAADLGSSS